VDVQGAYKRKKSLKLIICFISAGKYAVIEFTSLDSNLDPEVEVAPSSWLKPDEDDSDQMNCLWPFHLGDFTPRKGPRWHRKILPR